MSHCHSSARQNGFRCGTSLQRSRQLRQVQYTFKRPVSAAPRQRQHAAVLASSDAMLHSSAGLIHPDAISRRRDAEQRRTRNAAMAQLVASDSCWWQHSPPENMCMVGTPADLEQTLRQALTTHRLCVVDWFAPWCHACRSLYPKMRQIAKQHADVLFIKANADSDEMRELCAASGVNGLPYFRFHASGQVVSEFPANLQRVDRLRGEIEAQKSKLDAAERLLQDQALH